MTKHRVTKCDLERLALAELRQQGCRQVVAVEIEYDPHRTESNWRICTVDFGDARVIDLPGEAVEATHRKLWQQYNLMMDS
jgi:hypothetical protein